MAQTHETGSFFIIDDFGNEVSILALPDWFPAMLANVRFILTGAEQGISDGILSGTLDDDSLRYFGRII